MLYREIIAVCSQIHTEHINTLCGQNVEFADVKPGEFLGDKITMYISVILYWGQLIVLWLFHLVCILYCGCFNLFCNVCVSGCVGVYAWAL